MALTLMYITNDPAIALIAEKNGVDRIWVDLETLGKEQRQKGLNSVKSHHTIEDIRVISPLLTKAEMLVRVNPINPESKKEIDEVIAAGADIIMLNRDVLSQEKWNDEAIRNRNERLSAILLKLFYIDKPLRYVNLNDDSEKRFRWAMTSMLPAVSPKCVFYAVNLYLWIRFRQCCPKLSKLFTIWIAIL